MIDKLRKRMIWISGASFLAVFLTIFALICSISLGQLDATMDLLTDFVSGSIPELGEMPAELGTLLEQIPVSPGQEAPLSAQLFTLHFDPAGNALDEAAPSEALAAAQGALVDGQERSWQGHYRCKLLESAEGYTVVVADSSMIRASTTQMLMGISAVLMCCLAAVMLLIVFLSRWAVRPMAESYRKQRQFVTDANHELKTPLTLILTNLDILEQETGKNEWLDDIRAEGQRMSSLVNRLTSLSRMDEADLAPQQESFSLSEVAEDTAAEFLPLIERKGLTLSADIQPGVMISGSEAEWRQVAAILLDNAVKYCDPSGDITLTLIARRHPVMTLENTCQDVEKLELPRLFDRFYRADRARTAGSSFGIGLSLAQAIVQRHKGEITAYQAGPGCIGFRISIK